MKQLIIGPQSKIQVHLRNDMTISYASTSKFIFFNTILNLKNNLSAGYYV